MCSSDLLPGTAILAVVPEGYELDLDEAFAIGIRGVIPAAAVGDLLAPAIRCLAGNGRFIGVLAGPPVATGPAEPLTPREAEVVGLLVRGLRVGEVAGVLGIDIRTVSTYKVRAQHKLGVDSTAALVVRAIELGLGAAPGGQIGRAHV